MMATPILSGKLSGRYGERVPISSGSLRVAAALGVITAARGYAGFVGARVPIGLGVGLLAGVLSPAYQSFVSRAVPRPQLGAFNGLLRGTMGLVSLPALSVISTWLKVRVAGVRETEDGRPLTAWRGQPTTDHGPLITGK